MKKTKFSHKVIAVFLTLNFLTSIIPVNHLFANNNGPGSPEAAGFEPVDATDMVNLTTGDLSYVLPLMSVEGFPVSLSYHAGMTMDMDASWVGLGWYLNPGAINRSVTNTPDDWKSGIGINFNSFHKTTDYYGVTVEVGLPAAASVGVGLNWGGGQGLSGSVSATLGIGAGTGGMVQGGVSASVSTTGDASLGAGVGVSIGSYNAGAGVSYSLKNQWALSGGVSYDIGNGGASVGAGYSSNGAFSIGGSGNNQTNKKGKMMSGSSGGVGMSADSFSQGDASIDVQSSGIAVPLIVLPITLGFRKTRVKINIRKGFLNEEWGALYANDYNYNTTDALIYDVTNYNELFNDYAKRTRSLDTYSTRLPQSEEDFIGDYSKVIENINFTFMGYDNYNVAAQGLMGNMTPHVFQNATVFGKGERSTKSSTEDIHAFWHHGINTNSVQRQLGRLNNTNTTYNNNDFYFNFDGQFTSIEKNDVSGIISNSGNTAVTINDLITEGNHSGASSNSSNTYYGRAKSPNYVEVFTNTQIRNGHAAIRGLVSPATIPNMDRDNLAKFDPDGIGAYKVTSPDGKTYHFALPVYHFEQVQRGQIDVQEDASFNIRNVTEKRQYSRYATHWLLTAITGSDYIDVNNNGEFDKTDYGYWVELEYGKWSDGYVWRAPYQDRTYQYNTDIKGKIATEGDKGGYSFGRKQLYYLDKINTRNKTALFVKDIRYDAIGKNLKFQYSNATTMLNNVFNNSLALSGTNYSSYLGNTGDGANVNSLKYTNQEIYVKEYKQRTDGTGRRGVEYDREYSLKLSKIVLVDSDVGKNLSKSASGSLYSGYTSNSTCTPNWESNDFINEYGPNYSYPIHNEQDILDVNDVTQTFIETNALKVIELSHSYKLAKNSPSSKDVIMVNNLNPSFGRLTLDSVKMKGKGGAEYMPATSFNYYMDLMPNITLPTVAGGAVPTKGQIETYIEQKNNMVDAWGFLQNTSYSSDNEIKAWSLKDITMPTGAKIEIDYEEDEYWTEAFARRYWEDALMFKFTKTTNNMLQIEVENEQGNLTDDVDFSKYFSVNKKVYIDLWACGTHDYNDWGCKRRRGKINIKDISFDVINVSINSILLEGSFSSHVIEENGNPLLGKWIGLDYHPSFILESKVRGECANPIGCTNVTDRLNLTFKLLANKVPENENGGGLRVKELRTKDADKTYKVTYDYNHPDPTLNRSSGITSYAPVDGLKYVPYQSEIPAPAVMYEYVTMQETSNTGDYSSKTRYRHHVLKPVYDIFNPNIEMEALDADAPGEDNIFWANVTEDYGGLNGINTRNVEAKKIDVNINSALIGQIKSIENLNSKDQVMMRTENEYINGTKLASQEPNKGYTKETFNSMKTVFTTNTSGTVINNAKRLLSISSKTEYNNMLKKSITNAGGQQSYVEYSDVDPWLSSFRKSETTMADGTKTQSIRVPAYEKYTNMQSMVLNPTYKNMLTQEAMSISSVEVNGIWKTLNANITTWNNNWIYRDNLGIETTESGIWRRHKNYVWKEAVNATTGAYNTTITSNSNYFDWGIGSPINNKWENISEITRYTHWSSPIETKDINGNFAASKMGDNFSKVVAGGNARYSEMYYCGAEYVASGNAFEGEVLGANYRIDVNAHTGKYSVKNNNANDKVFKVSGDVGANHSDVTKDFRPGKYKVSFWMRNLTGIPSTQTGAALKLNGVSQTLAETVEAGSWKQYNYYMDLPANTNGINIYATNTSAGNYFFDDFRIHPIYASMNSYAYDHDTDELQYILDANNMATRYLYDPAGRLCKTYTEVAKDGTFTGGFKQTSKNEYYYKGLQNPDCGDCCDGAPPLQ